MKTKKNSSDLKKNNYETQAFWDIYWFNSAESLLKSAELLEVEVEKIWESWRVGDDPLPDYYQGPYYLLVAYAFENLFKGAIVRKNSQKLKQNFRKDLRFPKELSGHELADLASKAGFQLDVSEEDLLHRLSRSSIWAGRYPIPRAYELMPGHKKYADGKVYSTSWYGGDDIRKIRDFMARIKSELNLRDAT